MQEFDWFEKRPEREASVRIPITKWDLVTMGITESSYDRKLRMLRQLKLTCYACTMCELGMQDVVKGDDIRDPHVFSNMNPVRIVVVGQNPGYEEVKNREPFVGQAGANFDRELKANGLLRSDVYISNTVKCFTSGNAKPNQSMISRCAPFLQMELAIIKPVLVVALGAVAFSRLCPGHCFDSSLGKIVNSEEYGVKVMAIYHPSPLNMTQSDRRDAFRSQMVLLCKLIHALKDKNKATYADTNDE